MSICNSFNCALIVSFTYIIALGMLVKPFVKQCSFKFSWWEGISAPDKNRTVGAILLILGVIASLIIKLIAEDAIKDKWVILFQAEVIMAVSSAVGAAFISHGFSKSLDNLDNK